MENDTITIDVPVQLWLRCNELTEEMAEINQRVAHIIEELSSALHPQVQQLTAKALDSCEAAARTATTEDDPQAFVFDLVSIATGHDRLHEALRVELFQLVGGV